MGAQRGSDRIDTAEEAVDALDKDGSTNRALLTTTNPRSTLSPLRFPRTLLTVGGPIDLAPAPIPTSRLHDVLRAPRRV